MIANRRDKVFDGLRHPVDGHPAKKFVLAKLSHIPTSDEAIFKAINWWTLETVREQLEALMTEGICEAESTTKGIQYRRAKEPKR